MQEIYQKIREYKEKGACQLATVLEGPQMGEKMLLYKGEPVMESDPQGLLAGYEDTLAEVEETSVILLEGTRVFVELFGGNSRLVICGAGHVSMPLIQIGKSIGMQVTVLEDRPSFADNARKMGADRVLCDGFEQGLAQIPGSPSTYFVIVTRGHRYDRVCLEQILKKKRAYVGMMGSRRRVLLLKKELEATGISREELDEVHMPIGLPISAETPEEIAVSVMAEIIQCKNQKKRSEGYREEILDALQQPEEGLPVVLAEIVERKGSAPRAVGTKMVIRLDGKITGTIGGGCMEAEVIQKARQMLASENETYCMTKVDMSMEAAEDEGMVCGGTQLVYLEKRGRL